MEQLSVREVSERIDALLEELGHSAVAGSMERVEELVHAVMSLYGAGLERIVETLDDDTVRRLADDEVVGNLLVLHDLHPDDVDTRVQRALEQVRPYLGSHAGGVSLSGIDERGDGPMRVLGCDRQFRRDPGGVDNGLADQQIGQPPGRRAASNLNFAVPARTN